MTDLTSRGKLHRASSRAANSPLKESPWVTGWIAAPDLNFAPITTADEVLSVLGLSEPSVQIGKSSSSRTGE